MKRWVALGVLLMPFACFAVSPPVSGHWKIHGVFGGYESNTDCTFEQTDSMLSGSCRSDSGSGPVTGKVDGSKVSWSYTSQYNGGPVTVRYEGTIDAAAKAITGVVNVPEMNADGQFTAKQD